MYKHRETQKLEPWREQNSPSGIPKHTQTERVPVVIRQLIAGSVSWTSRAINHGAGGKERVGEERIQGGWKEGEDAKKRRFRIQKREREMMGEVITDPTEREGSEEEEKEESD